MSENVDDPGAPVEVYRTRSPKRAREHGLVLQATGLHPLFALIEGSQVVLVPGAEAGRARQQIALYVEENRGFLDLNFVQICPMFFGQIRAGSLAHIRYLRRGHSTLRLAREMPPAPAQRIAMRTDCFIL